MCTHITCMCKAYQQSRDLPEASFVVTGSGHESPKSLLLLSRRGQFMCLYTCVVYIRRAKTWPPLHAQKTSQNKRTYYWLEGKLTQPCCKPPAHSCQAACLVYKNSKSFCEDQKLCSTRKGLYSWS